MLNAMPQTPKPPSAKVCPSCGRLMLLQDDPDDRTPHADTADLSVVRFYLCANRACEHAERRWVSVRPQSALSMVSVLILGRLGSLESNCRA
jgi:hypothetical protein